MKYLGKSLIMATCLLSAGAVFAANAASAVNTTTVNTVIVIFSSPDSPVKVQSSNPRFTLTLQSNPTTGYTWFLVKYNNQLISSVNHKYIAPNSKLMGAPGYEVWTFKVAPTAFAVPQSTKVVMEYTRPWEKNSGTKSVFKVYTSK